MGSLDKMKPRILLVEDDEIAQIVGKIVFTEKFNFNLDIAQTGTQALWLLENNEYALIFMDLALLESDGFRITQNIRSRNDHKKLIPIIAVSAFLDDNVSQCCLKIGMNAVLPKPLTFEDCKPVVEKFLPTHE